MRAKNKRDGAKALLWRTRNQPHKTGKQLSPAPSPRCRQGQAGAIGRSAISRAEAGRNWTKARGTAPSTHQQPKERNGHGKHAIPAARRGRTRPRSPAQASPGADRPSAGGNGWRRARYGPTTRRNCKVGVQRAMRHCPECGRDTERYATGDCKPCAILRSGAYRAANPEATKANRIAWAAANPKKMNGYKAAWRAANPDKARLLIAAWAEKNPEAIRIKAHNQRARKRRSGGTLSKGLSAKLFSLQRGRCVCCQQPLGDGYHMDHVVPLVLGGTNTDDNIQLLRAQCNLQKYTKHPVDFMQQRGYLL